MKFERVQRGTVWNHLKAVAPFPVINDWLLHLTNNCFLGVGALGFRTKWFLCGDGSV